MLLTISVKTKPAWNDFNYAISHNIGTAFIHCTRHSGNLQFLPLNRINKAVTRDHDNEELVGRRCHHRRCHRRRRRADRLTAVQADVEFRSGGGQLGWRAEGCAASECCHREPTPRCRQRGPWWRRPVPRRPTGRASSTPLTKHGPDLL